MIDDPRRKKTFRDKKRISFFFTWYNMWIGAHYDRSKHILYICPLPCCVIRIRLKWAKPGSYKRARGAIPWK
jgi:hypothetical protein